MNKQEFLHKIVDMDIMHLISFDEDVVRLVHVTDKGCYFSSLDDPFAEKCETFLDALLLLVEQKGFKMGADKYKERYRELQDKYNTLKAK